jgi:hypothetical protein
VAHKYEYNWATFCHGTSYVLTLKKWIWAILSQTHLVTLFGRNKKKNRKLVEKGIEAGLPDGLFSYQKSQFGYILEGLGMEKVGKFFGH